MTCDDLPATIKDVNSTCRASSLPEPADTADPLRGPLILSIGREWALMHS